MTQHRLRNQSHYQQSFNMYTTVAANMLKLARLIVESFKFKNDFIGMLIKFSKSQVVRDDNLISSLILIINLECLTQLRSLVSQFLYEISIFCWNCSFSVLHYQMILSIDQSTTSTKIAIIDSNLNVIQRAQLNHKQITLHPGWLQHDPVEIYQNLISLIESLRFQSQTLKGVGITNQRQTVMVWDKEGRISKAIVWCDQRTSQICQKYINQFKDKDHFKQKTGLTISTYFSAFKLKWLMNQQQWIREGLKNGSAMWGNIDSWLLYKLSGQHCTDYSNASRTFLMNINKLEWDLQLLQLFGINIKSCPRLVDSFGQIAKITIKQLQGVPVLSVLGDQQSAAYGLNLKIGDVKVTYGTGCFLIWNTGSRLVNLQGFLTTILFKRGSHVQYGIEGSVQAGGAHINWMINNLGLIKEVEQLNRIQLQTQTSAGVKFYPYHGGIFSPYWKNQVSGSITGLTFHSNKFHIARALLQSIAFRVYQIFRCLQNVKRVYVDGGLTNNQFLMQFQTDLLGIDLIQCQQGTMMGVSKGALQTLKIQFPEKGFKKILKKLKDRQQQFKSWKINQMK